MVYKLATDEDSEIALSTLKVVLAFLRENLVEFLIYNGWEIIETWVSINLKGDPSLVYVLKKGKVRQDFYLANLIDEVIFLDRKAKLKRARRFGSETEIIELAQRVMLSKMTLLELSAEYYNKNIKGETFEEYVRKRLPSNCCKLKIWSGKYRKEREVSLNTDKTDKISPKFKQILEGTEDAAKAEISEKPKKVP